MSEFRVRPAHVSDAGRSAQIHIAAWRCAYRGIMDDEVLDRLSDSSCLGQRAFINVHPGHFGTGAASVLFDGLEDELRAQGWIRAYLMVAEGNDRAMRFYAKKGWQRTGITHVYEGVVP